jgi:hypothetical protein
MTVHAEALKWFLPFCKPNSLVASSSPHNWPFCHLNLLFCLLYELSKSNEVANFRWKLSSWNNRRTVCGSRLNGWNMHVRSTFRVKIAGCFLITILKWVWRFHILPLNCRAESISELFAAIGWTAEKLLFRGYFSWKFPGCSIRMELWEFWCFCFVLLNELNWWIW